MRFVDYVVDDFVDFVVDDSGYVAESTSLAPNPSLVGLLNELTKL